MLKKIVGFPEDLIWHFQIFRVGNSELRFSRGDFMGKSLKKFLRKERAFELLQKKICLSEGNS